MMRRTSYRPYFLIVVFFLCIMSIEQNTVEKIRSYAICSFVPCWKTLTFCKSKIGFLSSLPTTPHSVPAIPDKELERISQENQLLRSQMENVREWLVFEDRIHEQLECLKLLETQEIADSETKKFFTRRAQELKQVLELKTCSMPASVIFREPTSWGSTLWIDLGEKHNQKMGKVVVGYLSPVLVGTSIVGVVEHVEMHQSRVRLITDSRLCPSVRAIRGKEQNRYLLEHVESLLFALELRQDLFTKDQGNLDLIQKLSQLKKELLEQNTELYLAKGELHGTSRPLWRSRNQVLKGVGFNYDFADDEGPARDIRSGIPYRSKLQTHPITLLKLGDLLVTTGFDGVFPPGLHVATVSFVETLKEGATSYEIEAVATAGNLDELTQVFVLPPLKP